MKKKMVKRIVSFALAIMMVLTSVLIGGVETKAAEEKTYTEVTIADASFDDFWNNWSFNASDFVEGEAWPATSKAENSTVEFWRAQATEAWIYAKNGVDLEAGTYRMSVSAKASNDIGVRLALGDIKSEIIAMSANDFTTYSAELTLAEAGKIWIGFDLVIDNNKDDSVTEGWTVIDSIKLEKVTVIEDEYTFTDTEKVVNGDFTIEEQSGWTCTTGSSDLTCKDEEANGSNTFNFCNNSSTDAINLSLKQTITGLEKGVYRVELQQEGASGISGLTLKVGGTSKSLPATTGWNNWATVKSDEFTLTKITDITIEISGTVPASYWGHIDNIKLYKSDEVVEGEEDVYTISVTPTTATTENGKAVTLTANVYKNAEEIEDLTAEGLTLKWAVDTTATGHTDGKTDATLSSTSAAAITVTPQSVGKYYVGVELDGDVINAQTIAYATITSTATTTSSEQENTNTQPETEIKEEVKEETKEETKVEEKPVVIELENSNFTTSTDGTWKGEIAKGEWQKGNDMEVKPYSSDSYLELPDYVGTTGLKFNQEQGNTMTISQWVDSLKAGTYTITAPVMGENTDIYLVLGDKEVKATSLSGYNNWSKAKATFTIKEDMTDVKVGFKLVATSSGSNYSWGWIDSIQLVKTVPKTGDASNIYGYVLLMMAGVALVGYSVKRSKVQF